MSALDHSLFEENDFSVAYQAALLWCLAVVIHIPRWF